MHILSTEAATDLPSISNQQSHWRDSPRKSQGEASVDKPKSNIGDISIPAVSIGGAQLSDAAYNTPRNVLSPQQNSMMTNTSPRSVTFYRGTVAKLDVIKQQEMNPSLKFHAHLIERAKNQEKEHMDRRVTKLM